MCPALNAAFMTAGPDGFRRTTPKHGCGINAPLHHSGFPVRRFDRLPSPASALLLLGGDERLGGLRRAPVGRAVRFDLGTILAREPHGFDEQSGFLMAVSQDPVLSAVKMIAEPWDCGPGGYQVGGFPPGWAEWNDRILLANSELAICSRHLASWQPRSARVADGPP